MTCKRVTPNAWIQLVIDAAQTHGENSDDPDHEVGDLQGIIGALWRAMTPAQRRMFQNTNTEANDLITNWL